MGTSSNHVYVSLNETDRDGVSEMFKEFVEVHNRTYVNDPEEYGRRLNIFKVVYSQVKKKTAELKILTSGKLFRLIRATLFYIWRHDKLCSQQIVEQIITEFQKLSL